MSQPPYQPAQYTPAGPYAPYPPVPAPAAAPAVPQPAAPTQVVHPGQVQLPPRPQYAPTPQQAARLPQGTLASGFPNYRSPAPSPVNRTGLYVGILVCLLTIAFAVVGFALVA
ncbi:hypothetical protein [Geodermatophilus dictyosporus]|uniref:hypothetical protein n=1 Tax=Geodermatophilus dictyosporus TaxID=1523247 RepID=UPI000B831D77|nr:hypothetical protein [Geodermatophilus dictyosporus]